ncbi:MAG: S1 RNA-binding domain-containing protein [Methylococcaceae bacterium]
MNRVKREYDPDLAKVANSWVGSVVTGIVYSVEEHCAWVRIDALPLCNTGYLHVSQFSENRTESLRDHLNENEEIKVLVIRLDRQHDSWDVSVRGVTIKAICDTDYPINSIHLALVHRITPFGAILKLNNLAARIPHNESERLASVGLLEIGKSINVKILRVDTPIYGVIVTAGAITDLSDGAVVNARVSYIEMDITTSTKNGNKVEWLLFAVAEDGTLLSSKLWSWFSPLSRLNKGDKITAKILRKSNTKRWIYWCEVVGPSSLIEQFKDVPQIGTTRNATVQSVVGYAAFCTIIDGQDEMLHRSKVITDSIPQLQNYLYPADTIEVKIIEPDREDKAFSIDFVRLVSRIADEYITQETNALFDLEAERTKGTSGGFIRSSRFKNEVLTTFKHICVFCSKNQKITDSATAAEAAHIVPRGHRGADDIKNSLCLCKLHHWAFDRGFLSITEDKKIIVCDAIVADSEGVARELLIIQGKDVYWPVGLSFPFDALNWHRRNIFVDFKNLTNE